MDVGALIDALCASGAPYRPALMGGGRWVVRYSRGPLLWRAASAPGKLLGAGAGRSGQEFLIKESRVINTGAVLVGRPANPRNS